MAEIATVARPYAEAAFRTAIDGGTLAADADALAIAAAIVADPTVRGILSDPRVKPQQKKELFTTVAGGKITKDVARLLSILVDNHRDELVGEIFRQFEALKREHDSVVRARITSAQPLTDQQRSDIVGALEKRYGKKVEAEMDVDPELLGGARVQVGDQVIHASVRDALGQMAAALAR